MNGLRTGSLAPRTALAYSEPMCHVTGPSFCSAAAGLWLLACLLTAAPFAQAGEKAERTVLRLWYVPDTSSSSPVTRGDGRVLELYRRQHPRVVLRETAGIQIPQITGSAALLMAIAGGIAPDGAVLLLGDIVSHPEGEVIQKFLTKHAEKHHTLKSLPLYDAGSLMIFD